MTDLKIRRNRAVIRSPGTRDILGMGFNLLALRDDIRLHAAILNHSSARAHDARDSHPKRVPLGEYPPGATDAIAKRSLPNDTSSAVILQSGGYKLSSALGLCVNNND
jgi:hypothetical protein